MSTQDPTDFSWLGSGSLVPPTGQDETDFSWLQQPPSLNAHIRSFARGMLDVLRYRTGMTEGMDPETLEQIQAGLSRGVIARSAHRFLYGSNPITDGIFAPFSVMAEDTEAAFEGTLDNVLGAAKKTHEAFEALMAGNVDVAGAVSAVPGKAGEVWQASKEMGVTGFLGTMVLEMLVRPGTDLIEWQLGVDVTTGQPRTIEPEERDERIRNFMAFSAMIAVGGFGYRAALAPQTVVAKAMRKRLLADPRIHPMEAQAIIKTSQGIGPLGRDLMNSFAISASAGATWAGVRFANEDELLSEMILNGLVFAPVGMLFDLAFLRRARVKSRQEVAELATLGSIVYQFQHFEHATALQNAASIRALKSADDLFDAIFLKGALTDVDAPILIDGVSKSKIGDLVRDHGVVLGVDIHTGPSYTTIGERVLKARLDLEDANFFRETGFVREQIINYQGRDYSVAGKGKGKDMVIRDLVTGERTTAPANELKLKAQFDLDVPLMEYSTVGGRTLKGKFLQELKSYMEASGLELGEIIADNIKIPTIQQLFEQISQAATGKPFTAVALRQQVTGASVQGPIGELSPLRGHTVNVDDMLEFLIRGVDPKAPGAGRLYPRPRAVGAFERPLGQPDFGPSWSMLGDLNTLEVHRVVLKNPLVLESLGQFDNIEILAAAMGKTVDQLSPAIKRDVGLLKTLNDKLLSLLRRAQEGTLEFPGGSKAFSEFLNKQSVLENRLRAKIVTEAGFDGIVYKSGDIVDFNARTSKTFRMAQVLDRQPIPRMLGEINTENFMQNFYKRWRDLAAETYPESLVSRALHSNLEIRQMPDGTWNIWDKSGNDWSLIPGYENKTQLFEAIAGEADFVDTKLLRDANKLAYTDPGDVNWEQHTRNFIKEQGFVDQDVPRIQRELEKRLSQELLNELPPAERTFVRKLRELYPEHLKQAEDIRNRGFMGLARKAIHSGYFVDIMDGGKLAVRDLETGNPVIRSANSYQSVADFLNMSGTPSSISLDGGGVVPPRLGGGFIDSPDYHPGIPSVYGENGRMTQILAMMEAAVPWFTDNRQNFVNFDNLIGTKLFENVFNKLQEARIKANATIKPWYQRLKSEVEDIVRDWPKERRELLSAFIETMTPEEVINTLLPNRRLSALEIQTGQLLGRELDSGQIEKVLRFVRESERLSNSAKFKDNPEQLARELQGLKTDLGGFNKDMNSWVEIFTQLKGMSLDDASIGAITRLARSIMNEEVSRGEFARLHNMTPAELNAVKNIEKLFADLAKEFDIDPKSMLRGYFTHARLYEDGAVGRALDFFDMDPKQKDFYARMTRTGELNAYELDPVMALQRYIKAGFDEKIGVNNAVAEAVQYTRQTIKGIKEGKFKLGDEVANPAIAERVRVVADRYISDMQGLPGADVVTTQTYMDRFFDLLGMDFSVDVRKNISNGIAAVGEAAAQGARLFAGLRDFSQMFTAYAARFDLGRTKRMMELGARGLDGVDSWELMRLGEITDISPVLLLDPTERAQQLLGTGQIARNVHATTGALFRLSGQKDIYRIMHAGAYLEVFERSGGLLKRYADGEINFQRVRDDLKLYSYDKPVIDMFEDMVRKGQYEEASRFLGRQTGYEALKVYGFHNHPSGWNNNIGKVGGQFGGWPIWFRSMFSRLASRGSWAERAGTLAKVYAISHAINIAGAAVGLDMGNVRMKPGDALFTGGPVPDIYQNVSDAMSGYPYRQRVGRRLLLSMLPYDPFNDQVNIAQIYAPGSYAVRDWVKAFMLADQGGHPLTVMGQGLGFRAHDPRERRRLDPVEEAMIRVIPGLRFLID